VSGEAQSGGHVQIIAEPSHFEIVSGEQITRLASGVFNRVVEWRLKAVAPGDDLRIEVVAKANGDTQSASLPVVIHPLLEVD
jgi:hypothetical protein